MLTVHGVCDIIFQEWQSETGNTVEYQANVAAFSRTSNMATVNERILSFLENHVFF